MRGFFLIDESVSGLRDFCESDFESESHHENEKGA